MKKKHYFYLLLCTFNAFAHDNFQGEEVLLMSYDTGNDLLTHSTPFYNQFTYMKPSNSISGLFFSHSIDIDDNTLVSGTPGDSSGATGVNGDDNDISKAQSGAAFIFFNFNNGWSQQAYVKASNTDMQDFFGHSVAIDADTVVVGARGEDGSSAGVNGSNDNLSGNSGAVYVFHRGSNELWSQEAYIKASNTNISDQFGWSVSIDGNTLAVGATGEDSNSSGVNGDQLDNSLSNAGAVYIFSKVNGTWSQEAYIKSPTPRVSGEFGSVVSLKDDLLVVGGRFDPHVFVYAKDVSGIWNYQQALTGTRTMSIDEFGASIDISTGRIAVGAPSEGSDATGINGDENNENARFSGAAYTFIKNSADMWVQESFIKASNTEGADSFGSSVSLNNNQLLVGSSLEDSGATGIGGNQNNNTTTDSGSAYLFSFDNAWSQDLYIKASNTGQQDEFGGNVALSDNYMAVGSFNERSKATGINGNQSDDSGRQIGAIYLYRSDVIFKNSFGQ